MESLVAVEEVWKRYGEREALRDLRFSLRAGEAVGYLGPNGAGKTTTLKLLAGLSRPSRGSVRIGGLDPVSDRARALRHIGALVETPGMPSYLTGTDVLEYVARVKGLAPRERTAEARRVAEATGVVEHVGRPFGSLSTGLKRRVLLGATLVGDPQLLLLDEPTLGLDPAARQDLRELLRSLCRKGLTLLLSTHLLEDVEVVCDRVLFLRDGELVGDEPVRAASEDAGATSLRRVILRFGADPELDVLRSAVGAGIELIGSGPLQVELRFPGDDTRQVDLIRRVVAAGLPLLDISRPEPELARRYLERIGREDAT